MVLGTMALIFGMGALGIKGLSTEGKHRRLIDTNTKDPKSYITNLSSIGYLKANPQEAKKHYLDWLDYNFVLSNEETQFWSKEFDAYKNKLIKQRKNKTKKQYKQAKEEYYKKINEPNRRKHRETPSIHKHCFNCNLDSKVEYVLNTTFIGNEIDKYWIKNSSEDFLCINTKLSKGEIEKYYKICWNYVYNNDKDRF